MKKLLFFFLTTSVISSFAFGQDKVRGHGIGVSFNLYDFATAARIRSTSLSSVLRDEKWARLGEMSPGISLHCFKGLKKNVDFAGTISGTLINYPQPNKPNEGVNKFVFSLDAVAQLKLVGEEFWFQPFASMGVGTHKIGTTWGGFVPVGLGINIDLLNQGKLFISSQYRIPISNESGSNHYFHSIGISSNIK